MAFVNTSADEPYDDVGNVNTATNVSMDKNNDSVVDEQYNYMPGNTVPASGYNDSRVDRYDGDCINGGSHDSYGGNRVEND